MTRNVLASLALVALSGLSYSSAAHADELPRLAVVVSLSVNADAEQSTRLAEALAAALEQKFLIEAIAGGDVEARLGEDGVPDDCIADAECVRALAKRLRVQQLLLLTVVRVGERFQVAITWGDGGDGRTLSRVTVDIDVEQQDPGPVFAVYATRLLPDATPRPEPPASDGADEQSDGDRGRLRGPRIDQPPVGLPEHHRHMSTGSWIAAGAGATFLVAGLGIGWSARGAYRELEGNGCDTVACPEEDIDRLAFRAGTADVLFGAALVSGVTAAVLYWRSGSRVSSKDTDVAAYATGRELGVAIGGRF
jgi:hypothetical protein